MDRQEILDTIRNIGTCEDEAERRTMLSDLHDEITTVFENVDSLTENNNALTEANETLRAANTKLFLKVGEDRTPEDSKGGEDTPPEKRKFENLFNEKGELK